MYPNAPFWFAGLLVLAILGFWPSYFSPQASKATFPQHFHAVAMLVWVLMLIIQPWLIRTHRRGLHRVIGRLSYLLAPVLVISALLVVQDNLVGKPQPIPSINLSFFWLGLSSAIYFALIYILAIANRRDMQIHARYMAATALTFIVPAMGRLLGRIGEATGLEFLDFQVALWIPAVVGAVMVFHDRKKSRVRLPWALATVAIFCVSLGFYVMPKFSWFGAFAEFYLGLA